MKTSSRLDAITESTTLAISARAARLAAEGRSIISLSAGEPDFDTPKEIADAGQAAISAGMTRYTPAAGLPAIRDAVVAAVERDFGLCYTRAEICLTAGTKPAIYLALSCMLEPGDDVVVLAPYWVSYPDLVRLAGGRPRILETSRHDGFLPDEAELANALRDPSVRGIILNTPCNPTGVVWPRRRVEELVGLCAEHDRFIISDEIYAQLVYGDAEHVSPASMAGGKEQTILLNGLSKSFAMTGWRIGWLAGPADFVSTVIRAQSQVLGNPCSVSQGAAAAALKPEARDAREAMAERFAERRDWLAGALGEVRGFEVRPPDGAFYSFAEVQSILDERGLDDIALADRLLDEAGVAVVPGSAFGAPGHIRLSFAASIQDLEEAVVRLRDWVGRC